GPAYRNRAAMRQDVRIVAIADACEARRLLARQEFPGARIYPDHTSLIGTERGRLDFVDIATPPCDHAAIAHAALDAGLHVLCEKPLAAGHDQGRPVVRPAARA